MQRIQFWHSILLEYQKTKAKEQTKSRSIINIYEIRSTKNRRNETDKELVRFFIWRQIVKISAFG